MIDMSEYRAFQSSDYHSTYGHAENAINGVYEYNYVQEDPTCTHSTAPDAHPWWFVEMVEIWDVNKVDILGRQDAGMYDKAN